MREILAIGSFPPKNDYLWVTWSLLLSCNYTCRYCYVKDKGISTKEIVRNTLSFLKKAPQKIKDVTLFGGEPTLHPLLFTIIDELSFFTRRVFIFTNFSSSKEIIKKLVEKNVFFCISYHPDIVEPYKFIETLKYLLSLGGNVDFINLMMVSDKKKEVELVSEFCRSQKLCHRLLPIYTEGGKGDWFQSVIYSRRNDVIPVRTILCCQNGRTSLLSEQECILLDMINFKGYHCYGGMRSLFITHEGEVYRCQTDMRKKNLFCTVTDEYPKLIPYVCPYEECTCEYYIPKEVKIGYANTLLRNNYEF